MSATLASRRPDSTLTSRRADSTLTSPSPDAALTPRSPGTTRTSPSPGATLASPSASATLASRRAGNAFSTAPATGDRDPRLFEPAGSTLEDVILGAWEDLAAHGAARCPVCEGELEPSGCAGCGSELS